MSRRQGKVRTKVAPVVMPRALVRAHYAGEVVNCCGGDARDIDIAQRGVARQLLKSVTIYGLDRSGRVRDEIKLEFDADGSGDIEIDTDGGRRSVAEALDAGLARAVAAQGERMRRRGLKPDVYYEFHDDIRADEARLATGRAELGIGPSEVPDWCDGEERHEVLRMRPGRDGGMRTSFFRGFKGKR